MEFKDAPALALKASGDGMIEGYASTFRSQPDGAGDIVLPGAFARSLRVRPRVKLLWQHQTNEPIGVPVDLYEDEKGLFGRWRIANTDTGKKARQLVAEGLVDGLSIGYVTVDSERRDGARYLKDLDLHEVSTVTIPCDDTALITGWKSAPAVSPALLLLRLELKRRQLRHAGVPLPPGEAEVVALRLGLLRRKLRLAGVL